MIRLWALTTTALVASMTPAQADPLTVGTAILSVFNISAAAAAAPIILGASLGAIVGSIALTALAIGVQVLLGSFNAKRGTAPPTAILSGTVEQQQNTVRAAIAARNVIYGRTKIAGAAFFEEARGGVYYRATAIMQGLSDGLEEVYLGERLVTVDSDGWVTTAPWFISGTASRKSHVRVRLVSGAEDQVAFADLVSAFPGIWTDDHRARGVAYIVSEFTSPGAARLQELYPGGTPPDVPVVVRGRRVFDPRNGAHIWNDPATWTFSDNAALVILDWALRYSEDVESPDDIDIPAFIAFADVCDQLVNVNGGGTIKRWTLNGSAGLDRKWNEIVSAMCAACGTTLAMGPDGKLTIYGGRYQAPSLSFGADHIHADARMRVGSPILENVNELVTVYTSVPHGWKPQEAATFRNEAAIAIDGVRTDDLKVDWCAHHNQARRLAKIGMATRNPEMSLTITTNMIGFNALGQTSVFITDADMGLSSAPFRILKGPTPAGEGGVIGAVQFELESLPPASAWEMTPEEEGAAPVVPADTRDATGIPTPSVGLTRSGATVTATAADPGRTDLSLELQYRIVGAPTWTTLAVTAGQRTATTPTLASNTWEFQGRWVITATGVPGSWSFAQSIIVP